MNLKVSNVDALYVNKKIKNNKTNTACTKNTDCSNICKNKAFYTPHFARKWSEHKSWGAVVDKDTKDVSFKLFTFPDAKKVSVTVKKKDDETKQKTYPLLNLGSGVFATETKIPASEIQDGDSYFYTVTKQDGTTIELKDPYSFKQDKLLNESVIYDQSAYKWGDDNWFINNPERISRLANVSNGLKSVSEARIFEINIATLTQGGNFKSAKDILPYIKDMGFNAIEIMPVENTYSFNWGYDGVDKCAVSKYLGGPDELKSFINEAHKVGLNVIMDCVPNHLGPDGASLAKTGPYIRGFNDFGEAFNYNGSNSRYVRDFMVNAMLNWVDNYHCDGLRLDMTKYIESDTTMKQIAAEVNYHKPDVFLIAEDARDGITIDGDRYWPDSSKLHDPRVINPLLPSEAALLKNDDEHNSIIDAIEASKTSIARLGFDSEWDFPYYHTLKDALYGNVDLDKIESVLLESQSRVKYVSSHDEKGNFDGTALAAKLTVPMLNLRNNIVLNEEDLSRAKKYTEIKNCSYEAAVDIVASQKTQLCAEKLLIMLQTGQLDKYFNGENYKEFQEDVLLKLGISLESNISADMIKNSLNRVYSIIKMATARNFATPGPKMIFQGDENFDLTPFRFFRQFESIANEDNLYIEKGYKQGLDALNASKRGNILYNSNAKKTMDDFASLIKDLNEINTNNPALTKGQIQPYNCVKHHNSKLLATHCVYCGNEVFVVTNYGDVSYPEPFADKYHLNFPKGNWVEILNTDDEKYGGSGKINPDVIDVDTDSTAGINIASHSTVIFKKL